MWSFLNEHGEDTFLFTLLRISSVPYRVRGKPLVFKETRIWFHGCVPWHMHMRPRCPHFLCGSDNEGRGDKGGRKSSGCLI